MIRQTPQTARPSPTTLVGLLALLVAFVLPLAFAPGAEAFIYWTNQTDGTIGRADLDGTGVDERFIGDDIYSAGGVAVDARHIYWAARTSNETPTIARARLDGTKVDQTFVPAVGTFFELTNIGPIAVDEDHIYWAENSVGHPPGMTPPLGSIGRANLDGTGVEHDFIPFPADVGIYDVAVDANHIYWAESSGGSIFPPGTPPVGSIGRANLDGTGVDRAFITFPSESAPDAVEVDAAHVYWFSGDTTYPYERETIGRANLDGTGVDQSFIGGLGFLTGQVDLAVDAGHIYWAAPTGLIGRANLDGSGVNESFITSASARGGLAVNFSLGKLKKDKKKGTARLTVEVPAPGDVELAETTKVRGVEVRADVAGEIELAIAPQGRAKKKLRQKGKAKVSVELTYTPDGGEPEPQTATLKLVKRG